MFTLLVDIGSVKKPCLLISECCTTSSLTTIPLMRKLTSKLQRYDLKKNRDAQNVKKSWKMQLSTQQRVFVQS